MKSRSDRRAALGRIAAIGMLPLLAPAALARALSAPVDPDDPIAERILRTLGKRPFPSGSIGVVVVAAAEEFLGAPYRAHTLETEGPERLVMNLRAFDCVTLVESALAIARCVAGGRTAAGDVRRELTRIRYRDGVIDGYGSRLHYFSDWIGDNEAKGTIRNVTAALGGTPRRVTFGFMSAHRGAYPRLADPAALNAVVEAEQRLGAHPRPVISREQLHRAAQRMEQGDIIGITAATPGLDIVHTGLVAMVGGTPHLLHAPLSGGVVIVSAAPLAEMLHDRPASTGVVVARPLPP